VSGSLQSVLVAPKVILVPTRKEVNAMEVEIIVVADEAELLDHAVIGAGT
jgi:hypothetical protein